MIEDLTIQPVPEDRRKGTARHLFPVWFGVNIMPLTLVTGVLGTTVYGLPASWCVVAILIGNLLGAVLMALHSVQGSKLGVPQMIQARAQFGMYGALLVLAVVILVYLGFLASILILARDTLAILIPSFGGVFGLTMCALVTLLVVVVGYELIHRANRALLGLFGLAVIVLAVSLMTHASAVSAGSGELHFNTIGFMGMISAAAIWQIAYAPYVSDYSRYLPSKTSARPAFWYTYFGCVLGAVPMMILGALLVVAAGGDGAVADLVSFLPAPFRIFVVVMLFLGAIDAAVINLYGPSLTVLTMIQTFKPAWVPRAFARNAVAVVLAIVTTVVAAGFASDFLNAYLGFITFLMTLLIPWSIINLVDYYVIKRGVYDPAAFIDSTRGYGYVNVPAVVTYIVTFIVELPFASSPFFVGSVANKLGGVDLTWAVGSVVSLVLYLGLTRVSARRAARHIATAPAPA
ncbi:purine-cytosine permease family protein [Mycolicibacterium helvum]|uniref:Cytosine permease n=1 Tax=Mycolicibacterium helvum TaxID=1534349 RepID=A0A7I7TA59_9MYCO|nr:cytosine permease [Mycolicibacterium helvum]BBY65880.1 cytosine permease [Mycolicibacterium helvum]